LLLWAGYILTIAAALYSQYYSIFVLVAHAIFVLSIQRALDRRAASLTQVLSLTEGKKAEWSYGSRGVGKLARECVLAALAVALIYLPWVLYATPRLIAYVTRKVEHEGYQALGLFRFFAQYLSTFSIGHLSAQRSWLAWSGLLFFALAVIGVIGARIRRMESKETPYLPLIYSCFLPPASCLLLLSLLVPLLLGWVVNLRFSFAPTHVERTLLLAVPAYYLLIGHGLVWLWRYGRSSGPACLAALVFFCSLSLADFYTVPRYPQDDYRPLAAEMQPLARPDDVILCVHPWQMGYFYSYLPEPHPQIIRTVSPNWGPDVQAQLDSYLNSGQRLWFPAYMALGGILEKHINDYLLDQAYLIMTGWQGTTRLAFYSPEGKLAAPVGPINFENRLEVTARISSTTVEAGWGVILVHLTWQRTGLLEGTYHVALRLSRLDDPTAKATWGHQDSEPRGGAIKLAELPSNQPVEDRHGLLVWVGSPPGHYQVRLTVYRLEDGQPLSVTPGPDQPGGTEALLGIVDVQKPTLMPPLTALDISHPLTADLWLPSEAPFVRFLGYTDLNRPYTGGETLHIELFWQSLRSMNQEAIVFLQLQDANNRLWAAQETLPVFGAYPFSQWQAAELVRDPHRLELPTNLPPGRYHLRTGLLLAQDRSRLVVASGPERGRDFLDLGLVEILESSGHE